jgi:hypothetical protein
MSMLLTFAVGSGAAKMQKAIESRRSTRRECMVSQSVRLQRCVYVPEDGLLNKTNE